jgi:ABC-type phosphate/phosphonate transport system substrate-binding protein
MFGQTSRGLVVIALTAGLASLLALRSGAEEGATNAARVRIGMIGSLFRDIPEATVMAMMQPFGALMQAQTGVGGELVPAGDAENLGKLLADNKVQLGVFHGIEFAWARQKYPELRPLCIAVNQDIYLHAVVVVRADNPVAKFADLRDKSLALPHQTREHCYLYVQRQCRECTSEPEKFFSKISTPANVEEALDDVVDGVVQVVVVDGVGFDCYKRRKPGRCAKLKAAYISESFPAAVVAYRPGIIDEATLKRFRDGMVGANRSIMGKQLLTLWKLTGFEDIPADYEKTLTEIAKSYPPPVPASAPK